MQNKKSLVRMKLNKRTPGSSDRGLNSKFPRPAVRLTEADIDAVWAERDAKLQQERDAQRAEWSGQ